MAEYFKDLTLLVERLALVEVMHLKETCVLAEIILYKSSLGNQADRMI